MPDPITPPITPEPVAVTTPSTTAVATPSTAPDPITPATPPASTDFASAIPEAFKDKPYMKEVNSFDKLFADFDNAQSLIGQKGAEIPGKEATPEEITAYTEKIRPESKDAYEFPETEYTKKFGKDEIFQGEMGDLFHKAGLLPHQAKILTEGYDAAMFGRANEAAAGAEAQAGDFEKLADGHFGADKDAKLKIANEIMKQHTPEAFKPQMENLSNEALMVLSSVLNNVHDKFMSEDDLNIGGVGSGTDAASIQAEARALMQTPAYKDFRNPDHDSTVKRVNEMYEQVGRVKK